MTSPWKQIRGIPCGNQHHTDVLTNYGFPYDILYIPCSKPHKVYRYDHWEFLSVRSQKVVALFSAANFSSNIIELLPMHDTRLTDAGTLRRLVANQQEVMTRLLRAAICFEHKTLYILIRAPYTRIVVFWHISIIPPIISQSQISCNTPTFCIAAIFVKYCYTTGSWLL